jgi:hypothetical protein
MKSTFRASRTRHRIMTAVLAIGAVTLTLLMAALSHSADAQTGASAPDSTSGMGASTPMTNKAARPPGATASRPAEKKPAKAGAQSGPASAPPK